MDYTQSPNNVVDATTGFRRHEDNQALPTVLSEKDINSLIWAVMEVNKAAGMPAVAYDETVPASYTDVARAIRRLCGGNVTTFTGLAGGSAFALTPDMAGLVLVNATAGPVSIALPLANSVTSLPLEFVICRIDASANSVTVNRSSNDGIDGVGSFTLATQFASRALRSDAVASWFSNAYGSTAPQFDNSARLATTAFVRQNMGGYSSINTYSVAGQTMPASQANSICILFGTASTLILPLLASVPNGSRFAFVSSISCTISRQGADTIFQSSAGNASAVVVPDGGIVVLIAAGGQWLVESISPFGGFGQTWQVVSRALSTTYTNTTGRPIAVSVYWSAATATQAVLTVGSAVADNAGSISGNFTTSRAIVPVNATYKLDIPGGSIGQWSELR